MLPVPLRVGLLVALCALHRAEPPRGRAQSTPSDVDPQLTQELQRAERDFWNAAAHNDAEALDRLVAPEFALRVADIPQGSLPRAIWMKNTVGGLKEQAFQIRYVAARRLGPDHAAVSHLTESKGTIEGRDQSCVCYALDLWTKRAGAWQIVARYNIASDRRRERGNRPIPPPTDIDAELTTELSKRELQLGELAVAGFSNAKEIDRLVDPEFTVRTSDAPDVSLRRSQWAQPSGPYTVRSFEERHHAARKLADDLSVVSFLLTQQSNVDPDHSGTFYVVDVWKRAGDRWQLIARYSGRTVDSAPR